MSSDSVSTTAPEGRKSTKPIMEKRRRARINACLAELKSLLMDVIKAEGARHSKMEKADILEMTVRHMRQLQRQSIAGFRPQEQTIQSKYRMGYLECINEVGRFLGSLEIDDIELRTKIIEHLANSIAGARQEQAETEVTSSGIAQTPTLIRPRPEKPRTLLGNGSDVSNSNSVINLTIPQLSKAISFGVNLSMANEKSSVMNLSTPSRQQTAILQSPNNIQSGNITNSKLVEVSNQRLGCVDEKQRLPILNPNNYHACDNNPCDNQSKLLMMTQPETNAKVIGTSSATANSPCNSAQIFGGLQLLPTQLPSGDIVFIVPTNILPANQPTNYIIPVLSPKTMTSSTPAHTTIAKPNGASECNELPLYEPISLKSVDSIPSQSAYAHSQIEASKTVITTSADIISPPLLHCDTKQSNSAKSKETEYFSTNQNLFLSSPMAHIASQSLKPAPYPSMDLPVTKSQIITDSMPPMKMFFYSDPLKAPGTPKSVSFPHHTNDVSGLISSTNGSAHDRDISSPQHLVLNLSMQNRTRAEGSHHVRGNFPVEDENVWRPW